MAGASPNCRGSCCPRRAAPYSRGFFESFQRLARALPTGIFDSAPIGRYLRDIAQVAGRTDDFRKLRHNLFLVATDLDTAQPVAFGAPGWDDVPISLAVQASSALPGLFPPVKIGGRNYVDGALTKTLHASLALQDGAKLLICINPIVPSILRSPGKRAGRSRLRWSMEDCRPLSRRRSAPSSIRA
jgi:predicted acylesterase/phospholipase RssA